MKSFGLVAIMNRLAIPIPINSYAIRDNRQTKQVRVDFFQNIFVQLGDNQSILEGESTYMAKLNALSRIVEKVTSTEGDENYQSLGYSLILLDELGDGTDPEAGGCIAQAILEKIMESPCSITIATTHSSRIKALSITDKRFVAASVLLQGGNTSNTNLPTYRLSYGTVGQSHALSAATRIRPPFPKELLERAEYLVSSSQDEEQEKISIITDALEKERALACAATEEARGYERDSKKCRDALISLTRAYDQQLSRLESRIEALLQTLKNDENKDSYDILGESLSTIRLSKKRIKTVEEELKEKGLRRVSEKDKFIGGESVTIIEALGFEGERAIICHDQEGANNDEVIVEIEKAFDWIESNQDFELDITKLTINRQDLAVWDYPDEYFDWDNSWTSTNEIPQAKSVPDSRSRLFETLNAINKKASGPSPSPSPQTTNNYNQGEKKFKSSRARKAATTSKKRRK
jgi:dsDNA-specific endonuclease/ATPase MutS2